MDSVPSYRPASVPPPVIPPTPTHESSVLSGPVLIVLGFLFGFGGLYFIFGDSFSFLKFADSGTPPEEKQAAMAEIEKSVAVEGRTVAPVTDKLSYLGLIQDVNNARIELKEQTQSSEAVNAGYLNYLKSLREQVQADAEKASVETE